MTLLKEECGVFGVYNIPNAAKVAYYALHSLQHRGEEGVGIVAKESSGAKAKMTIVKGRGLLQEVIDEKVLTNLKGEYAIGHVSYTGINARGEENVQPLLFRHHTGDFSVCHNGGIINASIIRKNLEVQGSIFQTSTDAEIVAHLIKTNRNTNRVDALKQALEILDGGFAIVIMTQNGMYACRDRHGIRPLCIGTLEGGYVIASESCAFEIIGAKFLRDVDAGEMLYFRDGIMHSYHFAQDCITKTCAMEYVYFARPDSTLDNKNIYESRKNAGRILYEEHPTDADIVVGVPDSSMPAAAGYAEASGISFGLALLKNKYVGRTFIMPTQLLREKGVHMKLSVVSPLIKDKRVILIDDSIVRGTTSKRIVQLLRDAGAKEVHVRIASPSFRHPCYYGVDTETYDELISYNFDVDDVCKIIGANSLKFLSEQGLVDSIGLPHACRACFNGLYPTNTYHHTVKPNNHKGK